MTTWHDLLAEAQACMGCCTMLADAPMLRLHDEALVNGHRDIADAAQAFLDCPCPGCLDEIAALLAYEPGVTGLEPWEREDDGGRGDWLADVRIETRHNEQSTFGMGA